MNGLNNVTNSQSILNTTIQPSVLNGGTLSNSFNTQVMKVVKGTVNLSSNPVPQFQDQFAMLYPVINESTGNPIMLGQGDFIVGYGICNRSKNVEDVTMPITPANNNIQLEPVQGNTPVLQFKLTPQEPFYDDNTKTWSFDRDANRGLDVRTYNITPIFANGPVTFTPSTGPTGAATGYTGCVNLGFGSLSTAYSFILEFDVPIIYYTSCGGNTWLQLRQNYNPFTIVPPATNAGTISITLIVMTVISGTTESRNSSNLYNLLLPHNNIPIYKSIPSMSLNKNLYGIGPKKSIYYKGPI
jgi:hypothetical protein